MDDSGRLIVYAVWAVGSVVVWGRVFINALDEYKVLPESERRQDTTPHTRLANVRARAFRELVSDFSLLLVAFASFISLVAFIFGADIPGLRGFAVALALGAFLGAGIVRQPPMRLGHRWRRFRAWARR